MAFKKERMEKILEREISNIIFQEVKNEKTACLEIRNHIGWYFKGIKDANVVNPPVKPVDGNMS